jgi:putative ABC transport system permease protein
MAGISTLNDADLAAIRATGGVADCVPISLVAGSAEHGPASFNGMVVGAPAGIANVRKLSVEAGRFYTAGEDGKQLCVLSHAPASELFGNQNPVGQSIAVRGIGFTVAGVLKEEEEQAALAGPGGMMRNVIYLPFGAARESFGGQINRIAVTIDYRRDPDAMIAAIRSRMLDIRGGREDFGIITQRQLLATIYRVFNILTALLAGIAAISLVVAAIGIMNIMLVTVTERTHEIGIRKAVGARRCDVFAQFLTEAVVMSFLGGVLGTALAAGICVAVRHVTPLKPVLTPAAVVVAFGVCFVVGIAAGVAPAMRAARCSPIDALRHE